MMIAFVYLPMITYFGDRISRHFYRFVSVPHRLATSFLTGLLLATVITYAGSLAFWWFSQPLVMGNVIFLAVFALVVYRVPPKPAADYLNTRASRSYGYGRWDWICLGAILLFACWLMFATLNFRDGKFLISFKGWTDFGANISLLQSFVLGHNFPTQHPFFPGEPIRYHFLFWFQAANLEFLGLNPVWSINLLSIVSMLALLILIMTFAELLFSSKVVGRIAALLFFFSSSLYYVPFLRSQESIRGTFTAIANRIQFLPSGYPFRGEDWGVLTVSVFGFQRHLISGIAIFLVVMIFLVDRYQAKFKEAARDVPAGGGESPPADNAPAKTKTTMIDRRLLHSSIFSGLLIGLLPFWNSPVFLASLSVTGCLVILFPYRVYLASLLGTAILLGLPQVLLFKPRTLDQPIFRWGYTMNNPSFMQVLKYLGWSFGFKWLLILVALVLLSKAHRKLFLALSSLLAMVFLFQLSTDTFNNHKLLNIWAIFASIYAAYGLWRIGNAHVAGIVLASVLALATIFSGILDLAPLRNDPALTVPYENDRLTEWLLTNTKPADVFLSHTLLSHPILFTGRKIFLGNTLYAWSAGYRVSEREKIYRRMFEERDPAELVRLLRQQDIDYVAIDSGVRSNKAIKQLNESVYQQYFQKVFDDTEHQYDFVTIYRVPSTSEVPAN
jgi:hypothetical protein